MFILSCEPATCAIPEWHKELFRGQEEIVTSGEGWSPGSLNLAQAFATRLRTLLAHGDITRLLVDFACGPDDPNRFSRFSAALNDDQQRKLDDRHLLPYIKLLQQRIAEELRKSGRAIHLSIRTDDRPGMATVELIHDPLWEMEATFVRKWSEAIRHVSPALSISVESNPNYGLSMTLRKAFPSGFGSVSLVVARSSFLDGKPIVWENLKRLLLNTLPSV